MKLGKVVNITTVSLQRKATLADVMRSLLRYAWVFEKDSSIVFVDMCITDSMKDMMFSTFVAANFGTTYIPEVPVGQMIMENCSAVTFSEELGQAAISPNNVGIMHVNVLKIYISFPEDAPLMIQTVEASARNENRTVPVHRYSFNGRAWTILDKHCFRGLQQHKNVSYLSAVS